MVRRAAQILAVAHGRAAKLTAKAFALSPKTLDEADRVRFERMAAVERREPGQP